MKKIVYIAVCKEYKDPSCSGDEWYEEFSFDKSKAVWAVEDSIAHSTSAEIKKHGWYVAGYEIDVEDDSMSAREAWYAYNEDKVREEDPVSWEEIKVADVLVSLYEESIEDGCKVLGDEIRNYSKAGALKSVQRDIVEEMMFTARTESCTVVAEIYDYLEHKRVAWAIGPADAIEALDTNWDDRSGVDSDWTRVDF